MTNALTTLSIGLLCLLTLGSAAVGQTDETSKGNVGVNVPNPPLDENQPLADVGGRMGSVAVKLDAKDVSAPVQVAQGHIVGHLDDLLERMRKKVKKCCGGDGEGDGDGECEGDGNKSGKKPGKPLNESRLVGGPGGVGELQASGSQTKQFGDLPAHLRDRILQARERGFPERYEEILGSYYRRLAEQEAKKAPDEGSKD
jgi:hypothetical protein